MGPRPPPAPVPNAYNGAYGHSLLLVKNVVVQVVAHDGSGYYIASADCSYGTYVYDRTHGASLAAGDVISLVGKVSRSIAPWVSSHHPCPHHHLLRRLHFHLPLHHHHL